MKDWYTTFSILPEDLRDHPEKEDEIRDVVIITSHYKNLSTENKGRLFKALRKFIKQEEDLCQKKKEISNNPQ